MTVGHIAFVNSATDCEMFRRYYADSEIVRVSLDTANRTIDKLPTGSGLWIDAAIDGYEHWPNVSSQWRSYIEQFEGWEHIGEQRFQMEPNRRTLTRFVSAALTGCLSMNRKPAWVSVPQLPNVNGTDRNKINRELAMAAATWRAETKFRGKLILPVILRHQEQSNGKTTRNKKVELARQCYERANADGYWIVESSLADQTGSGTFEKTRFPGVINFHHELAAQLPNAISVAGPYWGLNLVIWARGLASFAAIGLGVGYQYHVPGVATPMQKAKTRIALPPLRRLAIAHPGLREWLAKVPKSDLAYRELHELHRTFDRFMINDGARSQVARFYKTWFDTIAALPPAGRALALFQDLSSAYVLGKPLHDLPEDEKTARRPERIAEQLMLQCL